MPSRHELKLERDFQSLLIRELKEFILPGCIVLKNDSSYMQGIPDLLILFRDKWAMLECKRTEPTRAEDWEPNQQWWLENLHNMSFAACIYPENKEEIFHELKLALQPTSRARR